MGRPIAWVGDPNSPDLTPQVPPTSATPGVLLACKPGSLAGFCPRKWPASIQENGLQAMLCAEQERRRIKRRIANRESARRVRARRQDMLEEMIEKVCCLAALPLCLPRPVVTLHFAQLRSLVSKVSSRWG